MRRRCRQSASRHQATSIFTPRRRAPPSRDEACHVPRPDDPLVSTIGRHSGVSQGREIETDCSQFYRCATGGGQIFARSALVLYWHIALAATCSEPDGSPLSSVETIGVEPLPRSQQKRRTCTGACASFSCPDMRAVDEKSGATSMCYSETRDWHRLAAIHGARVTLMCGRARLCADADSRA